MSKIRPVADGLYLVSFRPCCEFKMNVQDMYEFKCTRRDITLQLYFDKAPTVYMMVTFNSRVESFS